MRIPRRRQKELLSVAHEFAETSSFGKQAEVQVKTAARNAAKYEEKSKKASAAD